MRADASVSSAFTSVTVCVASAVVGADVLKIFNRCCDPGDALEGTASCTVCASPPADAAVTDARTESVESTRSTFKPPAVAAPFTRRPTDCPTVIFAGATTSG